MRLSPPQRRTWKRPPPRKSGLRIGLRRFIVSGASGEQYANEACAALHQRRLAQVRAAIEAREWRPIAELGLDWRTDDWVAARALTKTKVEQLRVYRKRRVHALFDGEAVMLDPGAHFISGGDFARLHRDKA
jgi:hypothetical protein